MLTPFPCLIQQVVSLFKRELWLMYFKNYWGIGLLADLGGSIVTSPAESAPPGYSAPFSDKTSPSSRATSIDSAIGPPTHHFQALKLDNSIMPPIDQFHLPSGLTLVLDWRCNVCWDKHHRFSFLRCPHQYCTHILRRMGPEPTMEKGSYTPVVYWRFARV